ncbi:hypothetical protein SAMN06309944_0578 [Micrococcales bacterium KH10]|nr:hypothetical protein SAMN06309944_0578 [Micrococcales bacterium KH10]
MREWHSPDGTPSAAYNENGVPFTTSHEWNYIVGAVDVLSPDTPGTLVAFGSSVVDGTGSEVCRPICAPGQVDNQFGNFGTNDIANNCSAEDIMAAMANTFQQLRANGIKIFVTPITPRPGYSGIQNNRRGEVNAFVRTGGDCSGLCDGVLDFDAVLKDPAQPNRIYPDRD